jgi:hypothetical protein
LVFGEPLGGEGWSGVDEGGAVRLHVDLLSNLIIFHFSIINWEKYLGNIFWNRGIEVIVFARREGISLGCLYKYYRGK